MTTIQVSDTLREWLARNGMGAGTQVEVAHVPATANSGRDRAPISNKRTGIAPAKFHRESVNTDRREAVGVNYGTNIDAAMASAMSRGAWRVVRSAPLLMVLDCENERHG